jgi:hypothetical protein
MVLPLTDFTEQERAQALERFDILGIFAQPLEAVHYAEKACWSDREPSVVHRYR